MDPRDYTLAILTLLPNETVPGRTVLQKLSYFCAVMIEDAELIDTFRPHYYGPYSESVARETSGLVALGFLKEKAEEVPGGVTRFAYSVSGDGRELAEDLRSKHTDMWESVRNAVERMTCHSVWSNTLDISTAAKVHFILSMDEQPMDAETIEDRAGNLGWDLSGQRIRMVISFLESLDLVEGDRVR